MLPPLHHNLFYSLEILELTTLKDKLSESISKISDLERRNQDLDRQLTLAKSEMETLEAACV